MRIFLMNLVLAGFFFVQIPVAKAESEAACAIWLCLPGGFPNGCGAAYDEFKDRIRDGKPPLPALSSCVVGPDGKKSNGRYQLGVELFEPCKAGFEVDQEMLNGLQVAVCRPTSQQCSVRAKYRTQKIDCNPYNAVKRSKSHFVKMWVDDEYLGQFFY